MKLNEIMIVENVFDDLEDSVQTPQQDKFGSIQRKNDSTDSRKPVITLAHINKLKHMKKAQMKEQEKRKELMGVMYSVPDGEQE